MTTLRTVIEELLQAVDRANASLNLRAKADQLRAALGVEPDSDGMVTEQDGFRVEAADQFGFQDFNDDCTEHRCTTAQLVAFTKGAERAGMWQACEMLRDQEKVTGDQHEAVILGDIANVIGVRISEIDAELGPIVEAERVRHLTSRGYVLGTDGKWIKPDDTCDGCEPTPLKDTIVSGKQIDLSHGGHVFVAERDGAYFFRFRNAEGADTQFKLSVEASLALLQLMRPGATALERWIAIASENGSWRVAEPAADDLEHLDGMLNDRERE